jgi:hypothetical protein
MTHKIEYFKEGRKIRDASLDASLDESMEVAKDNLIRHEADFFRIIDIDGSSAEVASGTMGHSSRY